MIKKTRLFPRCLNAERPLFLIWTGTVTAIIYLGLSWFFLFPEAVWSPDEGAKLLQLKNLRIENGRFSCNIPYLGYAFDQNMEFAQPDPLLGLLQVCNDSLCFRRLPIFAIAVFPFFRWFGFHGLYLLPAVSGALSSVLALLLLPQKDRRPGMWILIAFGSPVFIYALLFWEHTLATCLGLAGSLLVLRNSTATQTTRTGGRLQLLIAGLLLAISIYVRLEMLIFVLAWLIACLFLLKSKPQIVLVGIVLSIAMIPYPFLHQAIFSQPFPENARYLLYPFHYLSRAKWRVLPDLLIGPPEAEAINYGWSGELWAAFATIGVAHSFGPTKSWIKNFLRAAGLGATLLVGSAFLFSNEFYRSAHGLIFTTPWAILGLYRAQEVWQSGEYQAKIIVLSSLLGLAGYVIGIAFLRSSSPHGGLEWGARFAMSLYPPLALIAAWDLKTEQDKPRQDISFVKIAVFSALAFLGIGFQIRGIWVIHHDKQINATLNRAILEVPEEHIVSDLWWVPFNAAPIYPQKGIFVAVTPEKIGLWVDRVSRFQVQQFCLITLDQSIIEKITKVLDGQRLEIVEVQRIENLILFRLRLRSEH